MVRARNLPQGWIRRARCSLNHKDIQADVLRTGRTERIVGSDDRFDEDMFERFGHKDLGHLWVPVLYKGEKVAVIRGGCHRRRVEDLLTNEKRQDIERLAQEMAPTLAQCRSHVVLRVIAQEAIRLVGSRIPLPFRFTKERRLCCALLPGLGRMISPSEMGT